jgi:hypothetical protein
MLPAKSGMSVIMPAREACTVSVAYKIAVMKAITDIREHKMEKLLGTKFTHIPHDEEGEDPCRDSYKFAKRHPHAVAEHMDRCKHLLSVFYHVHGALVGEIQSLVDEITESTPTSWCTGETSGPPRAPTPAFSTGDFINLDEEVDPEERELSPRPNRRCHQHTLHTARLEPDTRQVWSHGECLITIVLGETPRVGISVSTWGRPEIRFHVIRSRRLRVNLGLFTALETWRESL